MPATEQLVVVIGPEKRLEVQSAPLPKYAKNEALVQVQAVCINPTDCKSCS